MKCKEMTRQQFGDMCKEMRLMCVKANKTESEWRNLTHAAYFFMKRSNSKSGWAVIEKIDNKGDL
jgi:hypothetical protein